MNISNEVLKMFARQHGRDYVPYSSIPINVLWGEYHGDNYDMDLQAEFIERFRPEVVLHELMGIRMYNPKTQQIEERRKESARKIPVQDDGREEINQHFMGLADEFGFLLVGCDLTPAEREYFIQQRGGRYQSRSEIIRRRGEMGLSIKGLLGVDPLDLADPERHKEMGSVYRTYRHTPGGILMATGLHHVRSERLPDWGASDLHDLLKPADYGVIENRKNIRDLALVLA